MSPRAYNQFPSALVPHLPALVDLLRDSSGGHMNVYVELSKIFGTHERRIKELTLQERRKSLEIVEPGSKSAHGHGGEAPGDVTGPDESRDQAQARPGDDDRGSTERWEITSGPMVFTDGADPDVVLQRRYGRLHDALARLSDGDG